MNISANGAEATQATVIQRRAIPAPTRQGDIDDGPAPRVRTRTRPERNPPDTNVTEPSEVSEVSEADRRWRELSQRRVAFPLTPDLDRLNAYAKFHGRGEALFGWTKRRHRRIHERYLCMVKPRSNQIVYNAIVARTLGFGKYVEKITYEQFVNGVRDRSGRLALDDDGVPVFVGLDISRTTLKRSLEDLVNEGLVERFEFVKGRWGCCAYMPFSCYFLLRAWIEAADDLPEFRVGRNGRDAVKDEFVRILTAIGDRHPSPLWCKPPPREHWDLTRFLDERGPVEDLMR